MATDESTTMAWDELEARIKTLEEGLAKVPALASMIEPELKSRRIELARLVAKAELETRLSEMAKALPTNLEDLDNVMYRKVAIKDGDKFLGWEWVAEINYGTKVGGKGRKALDTNGGKRAVHVTKVTTKDGKAELSDFGIFPTSQAAADQFGINTKGDSARRKLIENGYTVIDA